MILKIGDIVENKKNKEIKRVIIKVRKTGYTWAYVELPNKYFYSEDSNDPFFIFGWKKG